MRNTLFIGKVYHRFDELPSTNDWAAELIAKSKPPEGTVVRADSQTAGRGQFGSRWESMTGQNLLLSIILYPHWLAVKDQFYLSMAVALALHDVVNDPACRIKWPNDLYLGSKKMAGILIQNSIGAAHLQSSVAGIGWNVNQRVFDPALPNPTSLGSFFDKEYHLDTLLLELLGCLEQRYLQLKTGRNADIHRAYEAALYRLNEPALFAHHDNPSIWEGTIRGVSTAGLLQVEKTGGEMQLFDLKAIRMVV